MTALYLQTGLLLAAAFFLGAALACGLRKVLAPATVATAPVVSAGAARPVEPLPDMLGQKGAASAVERFERALGSESPKAATVALTPVAPTPVAPTKPTVISPILDAAPKVAPTIQPVETQTPADPVVPPPPRIETTPMPTPAALRMDETVKAVAPAAAAVAAPVVTVAAGAAPKADDLLDIRSIDEDIARSLVGLGASRHTDIAAWKPADLTKVSSALGFKGRIERENWIEQAQILASGGLTAYARRRRQGATVAAAPVVSAAPVGDAAPVAASAPSPSAPPIAATIAAAAATVGASASAAAAAAAAAAAQRSMAAAAATPRVSERAAFADARPATPAAMAAPVAAATLPAATPIRPVAAGRDALQRIVGINPEIERLLNVQGITRFAHIAAWGQPEVDRFDRLLGAPGRVRRENWIEQATMLSRGGETSGAKASDAASVAAVAPPVAVAAARAATVVESVAAAMPPDAPVAATVPPPAPVAPTPTPPAAAGGVVPRSDLSALRSVRSDAYQSRGAEPRASLDDLKRIRGIGVLIEKRLNSVGVSSYEQIANWTNDDVARFSQMLDFKGRIERESWIEQARILAAGGYTEFSRRVDKGDVETTRNRPS